MSEHKEVLAHEECNKRELALAKTISLQLKAFKEISKIHKKDVEGKCTECIAGYIIDSPRKLVHEDYPCATMQAASLWI